MATLNPLAGTTFTTPSDREVVMTRVVDAPRWLVFEAWTNPEHLPHWLLGPKGWSMPICQIDLRPGGGWHFVWRRSDGTELGMRGVYREIAPPERLVSTESWGGEWPETLNTLTLSEESGKTTIALTVLYPSKEARDAALETGMKEGASESFDRLAEYLRSHGGTLASAIAKRIRLTPIDRDGRPRGYSGALPAGTAEVFRTTAKLYDSLGFVEPWVGYLALVGHIPVGTCGFKSPPVDGRVEIAYFTFPELERRGLATAMAAELVAIAIRQRPAVVIAAQTLPERDASHRVLEKLGFFHVATLDHPEDGTVWEWQLQPEPDAAKR